MTREKEKSSDANSVVQELYETEIQYGYDRISEQREIFRDFSREARTQFRLILLLVGVPVALIAGFSPGNISDIVGIILSNSTALEMPIHLTVREINFFAGMLIILSAGLVIGVSGNEARGIQSHTNPEDIVKIVDYNNSKIRYQRDKLIQYVERIEYNNRIIRVIEGYLAFQKSLMTLSIILITISIFAIITDGPLSPIYLLIILILFGLPLLIFRMFLPKEYFKSDKLMRQKPLYNRESVDEFLNNNQ